MSQGSSGDGSWSRAFMVSSGLGVARDEAKNQGSPEWHEARGSNLPRARFIELAHHREQEVREALAGHPECPMGVLASLAHDHRAAVRAAAAANPRANQAILEHLARDRDVRVVKSVAYHPHTPLNVLVELAGHRKSEVRRVAVRVANERREQLAYLAQHQTDDARAGLPIELHESRARVVVQEDAVVPRRRNTPAVYAPRPRPARDTSPTPRFVHGET